MPRLALKPDSSFFRKIATGAAGARFVVSDLERFGHVAAELERGSTDVKLWKEVKRKRVRIPDLVCTRCGTRIECRAKSRAELAMSHSATEAERAWDFGMVDGDVIAFPVCAPQAVSNWSLGQLEGPHSYWHEREWIEWACAPYVNYFAVAAFRTAQPDIIGIKGVTEGSETVIGWKALFSTMAGAVETIGTDRVTIVRQGTGRRFTWRIRHNIPTVIRRGDLVAPNQIIASEVPPLTQRELQCSGTIAPDLIYRLLNSRERTQRYTGVKLARLRSDSEYASAITNLNQDQEEDIYVRLEAAAYLSHLGTRSASDLFEEYFRSPDEQIRLEAVIALAEVHTDQAVEILSRILNSTDNRFYLRSAAAWALSQSGSSTAAERLVEAFSDIDVEIRREALSNITNLRDKALPVLLAGVASNDPNVAAGCAEALRHLSPLPVEVVSNLARFAHELSVPVWPVWLLGNLARDYVATEIAGLQHAKPELHFAMSVLWSFSESWISQHWEQSTGQSIFGGHTR